MMPSSTYSTEEMEKIHNYGQWQEPQETNGFKPQYNYLVARKILG